MDKDNVIFDLMIENQELRKKCKPSKLKKLQFKATRLVKEKKIKLQQLANRVKEQV